MMATRIVNKGQKALDGPHLEKVLQWLALRLEENHAPPFEIVVCGGAALILSGLVVRTTTDVDIVALASGGELLSPAPLPEELLRAARETAEDLGLPENWLNNGPSQGEGGLFQMGLPPGIGGRLHTRNEGPALRVHFIDRLDQIFFKLYAAVDRGGYHIEDLTALEAKPDEMELAARWAMTHDISKGFALILRELLRKLGYAETAGRLR